MTPIQTQTPSAADQAPAAAPQAATALLPAPTPTPWQGPGVVCAATEGGWLINADTGSLTARVAASCLLQPQVGDTVWCCGVISEVEGAAHFARYWLTQVLERAEAASARVELPANATLATADGRMALHTNALLVRSERMDVVCEQASVIGGAWEAVVGAVMLTGQTLRSVFDRVTHTAQHHQRVTSGSDIVQANMIDLRAGQLASVQGEHVLVQGEKLIKSRAAQIHMG